MQSGLLLFTRTSHKPSRFDYFRSPDLIVILHFKLYVNKDTTTTLQQRNIPTPLPTMSYKTNYELYVSNIHALLCQSK
jgi:hypothetical protein